MTNTPFASRPERLNKIRLCNALIILSIMLLFAAATHAAYLHLIPDSNTPPILPLVLTGTSVIGIFLANILGRSLK